MKRIRKRQKRESFARRLLKLAGMALGISAIARSPGFQKRLDDAEGDIIEALHGHKCGPGCWHHMADPK